MGINVFADWGKAIAIRRHLALGAMGERGCMRFLAGSNRVPAHVVVKLLVGAAVASVMLAPIRIV